MFVTGIAGGYGKVESLVDVEESLGSVLQPGSPASGNAPYWETHKIILWVLGTAPALFRVLDKPQPAVQLSLHDCVWLY